jgi:hypothetical protein
MVQGNYSTGSVILRFVFPKISDSVVVAASNSLQETFTQYAETPRIGFIPKP